MKKVVILGGGNAGVGLVRLVTVVCVTRPITALLERQVRGVFRWFKGGYIHGLFNQI